MPAPADPTGELYTALGFNRGFLPDSPISPYAKLLPMLAGIGSPGTIQVGVFSVGHLPAAHCSECATASV